MDLRLYGLAELEELGHDECNIAAFCRNPLHPGPCRGWKRSLRAVAPELHDKLERDRIGRVESRRKARTDAAAAEGRKAPKFRKMAHERAPKDDAGPEPKPDQKPVSDERAKRIRAADDKFRQAGQKVDRKGQGKGRDGDGDGIRGEGEYEKKGRKPGKGDDEAGFWSKLATERPAPLKSGEHRKVTSPDGTTAEVFQTGSGMFTVQVRDGDGTRRDLTRSFEREHQALQHFQKVAQTLADAAPKSDKGDGGKGGDAAKVDRMRRLLNDPEADDYDITTAAAELSAADLRAMTPDERSELRKEMDLILSTKSTDPDHLTDDAENKARARQVVVRLSNVEGKGTPQGGGGDFPGGGKTVGGKESAGGELEVKPIKGDRRMSNLRTLVNAGPGGYPNKRGFMNKKDVDFLVDNNLATRDQDGTLHVTDHGRAVYDVSIPRRNGEEIGWDGKTDSERRAELEAAEGAERKRLEAEAKQQFEAGIPPADRRGDFGGPTAMRAHDSTRKLAAQLKKDLGESMADYSGDVSPAAKDWVDKMREVDLAQASQRQALGRRNWLLAAQIADPGNAAEYKRLYEETKPALDAAGERVDRAVQEANAARETLGAAIIGRYQGKGKRKTMAGLKIPEARKENVQDRQDSALYQSEQRIREARSKVMAATKGLDHNLEPWQIKRAEDVGNDYGRAIVEREKADAALESARFEASMARDERERILARARYPELRTPEWEAEHAAAYKRMNDLQGAANRAETRQRDVNNWVRRATVELEDVAKNLRAEQARRGGPKPETSIERERRLRAAGAAELAGRRAVTEAGVRAMAAGSRSKLLADAKKRGIEVKRGQSEEDLIKAVIDHEEDSLDRKKPSGLGGFKTDPKVVERLYLNNRNRRDRSPQGDGMAELEARAEVARGQVPWRVANAAADVATDEGLSFRDGGAQARWRELLGLPQLPAGTGPSGLRTVGDFDRAGWTQQQVKRSELRAGDLLGNMTVTSADEPDERGWVGVQGLGMLGMDTERPQADGTVTIRRPPARSPFGSFPTPNRDMTPSDRDGEAVEVRAGGQTISGTIVGQVGGVKTAGGSAGNSFYVVRHPDGTYNTYDTRVVHAVSPTQGGGGKA